VRSRNHRSREKALIITFSECVFVALINQQARQWAMLPSVAFPLYNIFPHYLIIGTIFQKKVTECKMGVLIFSTTFV
jgi:hypothetical protein